MPFRFLMVFLMATVVSQAQVTTQQRVDFLMQEASLTARHSQDDQGDMDRLSQAVTEQRDGALPETPGITITPHPVHMTAVIRVSGVDPGSEWTLVVSDLFGRTMHKRRLAAMDAGGDVVVDVQQYSSGVYTVILSNGKQTLWKNMVVRSN